MDFYVENVWRIKKNKWKGCYMKSNVENGGKRVDYLAGEVECGERVEDNNKWMAGWLECGTEG